MENDTQMPEGSGTAVATSAGLLAFLIVDIRDYTPFTAERGNEAAARLTTRFADTVRDVARRFEGALVETKGDEALVAFNSVRSSVQAALALQERLESSKALDADLAARAGVGLDVGEVVQVPDGYRGAALNLASRLCSVAGAGDILASEQVVRLAGGIPGVEFRDRGEATLKGLPWPVRVFEVAPEGSPTHELARLRPFLTAHSNNLMDEPTPFVAREREVKAVQSLLLNPAVRLLTLTGPGGIGKTRLGLHAARGLLSEFPDGVFFVSLASLSDPDLVPSVIDEALGIREDGNMDSAEALFDYIAKKRMLVLLDNIEQLPGSFGLLARLLDSSPNLRILVTSRTPLHLLREHEYEVPPLATPDPAHLPPLDELGDYGSVALFVERARTVRAGFGLTEANAHHVAAICRHLDGLPLAIELAAARIRLFPPQALLDRLSSSLDFLTTGPADLPARQQTLRGAIDWSYSLLSGQEQQLFARLSVFVGGASLEAVEAVCGAGEEEIDLLDELTSLVEKSLLRQGGDDEPRFSMLETIREYAAEKLKASGDEAQVRDAHVEYFTRLAEAAAPALTGPEQGEWMWRLEADHDNLRAAFDWALEQQPGAAVRLGAAIWMFWRLRGHLTEGASRLERALDASHGSSEGQLEALNGASVLLTLLAEYDRARTRIQQHLAASEAQRHRQAKEKALSNRGVLAGLQGDLDQAVRDFEASLALGREMQDPQAIGIALLNLGIAAVMHEDTGRARALLEEGEKSLRSVGDVGPLAATLAALGNIARTDGDRTGAASRYRESIYVQYRAGILVGLAENFEGLALCCDPEKETDRAARLAGFAAGIRDSMHNPRSRHESEQFESELATIRSQAGDISWATAWESGRRMTVNEAVEYALADVGRATLPGSTVDLGSRTN